MRTMRTRWTAVLLALVAVVGMALVASAAPIANGVGPELVSDQQDIALNASGQATLFFDDGAQLAAGQCLSGTPIVAWTPVRNVSGGLSPVDVQSGQNTPCSIVIVVLNKFNAPIANQTVRLTYLAIVKGTADIPTPPPAPPAP
jgi:hypothetical protein